MLNDNDMDLVVERITDETSCVRTYELGRSDGKELEKFEAGAHLLVYLPNGLIRSYSLCGPPAERHRYLIAVKREDLGSGGSKTMFLHVKTGDRLRVSSPRNFFPLSLDSRRTILIAGGIGITPILAMVHELRGRGATLKLYYCTRSPSETAFHSRLRDLDGEGSIVFHHDGGDPARALAFGPLLQEWQEGLHLYCCGPRGLMRAVYDATSHWPSAAVHFEDFQTPTNTVARNHTFTVTLASTAETFVVPSDKSILDVLTEKGVEVPSSCEAGTCGTCTMHLLSGEVEHRDHILSDAEREKYIAVCVSRARSDSLVIDI